MALSSATLYNELLNLGLYETEVEATAAWATAFDNYWQSAMAGTAPVTPESTVTAKTAMQGSLAGMAGLNAGATKIAAGITDYWNTLVLTPTAVFATSTLITPSGGLVGLQPALEAVFAANASAGKPKEAAYLDIANAIHATQLLGSATFPGPLVFPIT